MDTPRSTARRVVAVTESIWIDRPPDVVFDYTQDYARRTEWDAGVTEAALVGTEPRTARIVMRGLGSATLVYRLDRRPERTSLAFRDVRSAWITGGGGSWDYEPVDGGTRWQQTNTLELKRPTLMRLLAPLVERSLRRAMRQSMVAAKARLESTGTGASG